MEERRHHKRFAAGRIDLKGRMLFTNEVKVIDVSIGGIFVKADRRFEIGREYSMKIEYEDKIVSLDGVVVWSALSETGVGPNGQTVPIYRAGIKFTVVSTDKLNELMDFIGSDGLDDHEVEQRRKAGRQGLDTIFNIGAPERISL